MSSSIERIRLPVELLRHGLYVAECDRPWDEIPLMFQGFTISTDEEVDILRRHCRSVYVDIRRSREDAVETLPDAIPAAVDSAESSGRSDPGKDIGNTRRPSPERFRAHVEAAGEARGEAHEFITRAFQDARLGHGLDTGAAREVIPGLVDQMTGNATAALWLTSLRGRDTYTEVHSINVCVLSLAFAMNLGLEDRAKLERIALGALLHDVGKMKIPAGILNKPGPLTAEEWEVVKTHPEKGHEIVAESADVPQEALEIILLHHERRGGQGYPMGLRGGQLPQHVQIVALANAYDSLTSARPYRPPEQPDKVLQDFYNEAEDLFGRDPVERFIRCVGIYPVGSLVELDNGAVGVVVGSPPDDRLRPTVLLVRTPDGELYDKRVLLNLAADAEGGTAAPARAVRRVLDPAEEEIDVAGIVAFEFGFDLS